MHTQSVGLVLLAGEVEPWGQTEQDVPAVADRYVPAMQFVHTDAFWAVEYVPGWHDKQEPVLERYIPALHTDERRADVLSDFKPSAYKVRDKTVAAACSTNSSIPRI